MTKEQLIDELCERYQKLWTSSKADGTAKYVYSVDAVRDFLTDSVVVHGTFLQCGEATDFCGGDPIENFDTHQALLIGIRPISRKVKVSEVIEYLEKPPSAFRDERLNLAQRIREHGIEGA